MRSGKKWDKWGIKKPWDAVKEATASSWGGGGSGRDPDDSTHRQQPNCAELLSQSRRSCVCAVVSMQMWGFPLHTEIWIRSTVEKKVIFLKAPCQELKARLFPPSTATSFHHLVNPLFLFLKFFSSRLDFSSSRAAGCTFDTDGKPV